jgi:hypothetical protein
MENNDFTVTIMVPVSATYDAADGFGDFVNYRERSLGVIGATSAAQAIELVSHLCPKEFKSSLKAVLVA